MLQVAEAFSRHQFRETYPHMADDIRWHTVGGATVVGRDAVIAACDEAAAELAEVQTRFVSVRARAGDDFVVVEATADYDADSRVSACDLYTFADGRIMEIVSYNIEVEAQA